MKIRTKVNVGPAIAVGHMTRNFETVYGYEMEVTRNEWGQLVAQVYAEVDMEIPVQDVNEWCEWCGKE